MRGVEESASGSVGIDQLARRSIGDAGLIKVGKVDHHAFIEGRWY